MSVWSLAHYHEFLIEPNYLFFTYWFQNLIMPDSCSKALFCYDVIMFSFDNAMHLEVIGKKKQGAGGGAAGPPPL